jgi:hypothetical protein
MDYARLARAGKGNGATRPDVSHLPDSLGVTGDSRQWESLRRIED